MAETVDIQTEPHILSPDKGSISFAAYIDGDKIECVITAEALKSYFGSADKPIDQVFSENQEAIRSMAEFLLTSGHQRTDGHLLIVDEDFRRRARRR
ncbi:MAG TPA: DUF1488 family protein [Gammaproteobacteria bacterium]|nr:DUF1488 family protein [Gammaproteobacteria bacterium]